MISVSSFLARASALIACVALVAAAMRSSGADLPVNRDNGHGAGQVALSAARLAGRSSASATGAAWAALNAWRVAASTVFDEIQADKKRPVCRPAWLREVPSLKPFPNVRGCRYAPTRRARPLCSEAVVAVLADSSFTGSTAHSSEIRRAADGGHPISVRHSTVGSARRRP